MKLIDNIAQNVSLKAGRATLKLKANAPTIAIVGGLVCVGVGVGIGTYRSIKYAPKIDEYYQRVKNAKETEGEKSEKHFKEVAIVRAKFVKDISKIYGMPLAMVILGTGAVLYGNHLFKARNLALAGSNAIFQNQVERLSKEIDNAYGEGSAERIKKGGVIKEVEVEDGNGNGKTKKKKAAVIDYNDLGDFCLFFDQGSSQWHKSSTLNMMAIKNAEKMLTKKLRMRGYLFLDEAYDFLDVPIIDERMKCIAHSVGWIYDGDKDNPKYANHVSFRVFDNLTDAKINFVNGYENVILLDPNVDGDIYSKMMKGAKYEL